MKATQLSKGCLDTIQHNGVGGKNETNIVQVLEARVKEQPKGKSLTLKISDGAYSMRALVKSFHDTPPQNFDIINISDFSLADLKGNKILMVNKYELIYANIPKKIGDPVDIRKSQGNYEIIDCSIPVQGISAGESGRQAVVPKQQPRIREEEKKMPQINPRGISQAPGSGIVRPVNVKSEVRSSEMKRKNYRPIRSLTLFGTDWTIKARITMKGEIKHWKNQRGEGYLLPFELIDEDGVQICATLFNDAVDKFNPILQQDKVYLFSSGTVKVANKRFTSIKNDLCITFDKNSSVEEVEDDSQIQTQGYTFTSLKEIMIMENGATVDVIGILVSHSEASDISRKDGTTVRRKAITICDETNIKMEISLWGEHADSIQFTDFQILAIKSLRVREFQGKNLSANESSTFAINPDHPRAAQLCEWGNTHLDLDTLQSAKEERTGSDRNRLMEEFVTATEGDPQAIDPKGKYAIVTAIVMYVNPERVYYTACIQCKKKVVEEANNSFRCEACDKLFDKCDVTYIVSMNICDSTHNMWVTAYGDSGETILGAKAQQLKELKESNEDEYNKHLNGAKWKSFAFSLRAKLEMYNSEEKVKYSISRVYKRDFLKETKMMLKRLEIYSKIE